MRHTYPKKHIKGLLSASAIALTLSVAPAYGQSSSAQTGYSTNTSNPVTTTTTSGRTRTVVGRDNTARTQTQTNMQNRMDARTQNRSTYGTGTTASARGGEIITRSGPVQSRNTVTVEQTRRSPRSAGRYQTQSNMRSQAGVNNAARTRAQARTGTPTAPQFSNRYSPERLSEIETAVGTTTTTIERTSPETQRDMYRRIENNGPRIDLQLKQALSRSRQNRDTTYESQSRLRTD